jgi:YVTN family beta-propeller protein
MKFNKLVVAVLAGSLFFVSCSNDDDTTEAPSGAYDNGVLVLNQGNFNAGNASVSFISDALTVENNIFQTNSGRVLGDVGQDIGLEGNNAYIVVNNSGKIEVANRYTFAPVATISGLVNPRYIAFENGKGYVTCWGAGAIATDDYVAVIDLATNTVSTTIPVAEGPEKIIEENGKLYVAHKGGFGFGNSVTVINTANNAIVTTITVGGIPGSLEEENGTLYVLSEGYPSYAATETAGSLTRINMTNNTVISTTNFAGTTHPSNLVIEGGALYYTVDNTVFKGGLLNLALPTTPLFTADIATGTSLTALTVEDNTIYIGSGSFSANGNVKTYSLTGTLQQTLAVGVAPTGFYFND